MRDRMARNKMTSLDRGALIVKAWNAFVDNRPVKTLKVRRLEGKHTMESFPEVRTALTRNGTVRRRRVSA